MNMTYAVGDAVPAAVVFVFRPHVFLVVVPPVRVALVVGTAPAAPPVAVFACLVVLDFFEVTSVVGEVLVVVWAFPVAWVLQVVITPAGVVDGLVEATVVATLEAAAAAADVVVGTAAEDTAFTVVVDAELADADVDDDTTALLPPATTEQLYALTVNTASVPVKGSVPAPMLSRYWDSGKLWSEIRYVKKSRRSPSKLSTALVATKLKTCMFPFKPEYSDQVTPATVGVAMALPVDEMGPAPPRASSQIMTSYSSDPPAVDEVNMS
jgi:hypothetical protein